MRDVITGSGIDMSPNSNSTSVSDILRLSDYNSSGMKESITTGSAATATTATTDVASPTEILATSLNTPSLKNRVDAYSDTNDCMKLTPVNLRCFSSPVRHATDGNAYGKHAVDDSFKENFGLIARQLEKLLDSINIIFKEIGYSNSEIISKEKMIFKTLSDSIATFSHQAELEKRNLSMHNDFDQDILNRILEIIDDNMGINAIPDLYTRNAILITKNKPFITSPKKPLSLLSKNKLLHSGKIFVFKVYVPKLLNYLNGCIQFQLLYDAVNEELQDLPHSMKITSLPNLELAIRYRNFFKDYQNDIESIAKFIRENKTELLFGRHFNNISKEIGKLIADSIKLYQREYNQRLERLSSMSKTISDLFSKLHVSMENDVDSQTIELLNKYSFNSKLRSCNKYLPVSKDVIEKLEAVLKGYQLTYQTRLETRDILLNKCQSLWYKLKVPEEHVEKFLSQNSTLSATVLKRFSIELDKLENMKKKLIKTLISDSWRRIEELWATLQCDSQECTNFLCKFDSLRSAGISLADDERLLKLCEDEIQGLEEKLAIYEPVLKLIDEFKQLQDDKLSLEESSKDSSRLLLRNSHKILLQEEKTRKRITRHFPRIIQDLKLGLAKIEEVFGKPLNIDGVNLIEMVTRQEDDLLSKYPRSRLNLGSRRSSNASVVKRRTTAQPTGQKKAIHNTSFSSNLPGNTTSVEIQQTPATRPKAVNMSDKYILSSADTDTSSTRYVQGLRFSSPVKPMTRLLPPTIIARKSGSRIPEPKARGLDSLSLVSSPVARPRNVTQKNEIRNDNLKSRRLFPISSNRINQQNIERISSFEALVKNTSITSKKQLKDSLEKENVINSTPRLSHSPEKAKIDFSSPYREPDNSVYKLSTSPEGKCTINIQENGAASGLDDTSIMDEENDKYYDTWKKEQILKLKDYNGL